MMAQPTLADGTYATIISTFVETGWAPHYTVVSLAPFNNLPTRYRVTIDGEQKWFAQ